jgi:hypothetical protein
MKNREQIERKIRYTRSALQRIEKKNKEGKVEAAEVKRYVELNKELLTLYWVLQ